MRTAESWHGARCEEKLSEPKIEESLEMRTGTEDLEKMSEWASVFVKLQRILGNQFISTLSSAPDQTARSKPEGVCAKKDVKWSSGFRDTRRRLRGLGLGLLGGLSGLVLGLGCLGGGGGLWLVAVRRSPEGEVVTEQLHDEGAVAVRLL